VVKERYFPSGKTYHFGGTKHCDNWMLNVKKLGKYAEPKENWIKSYKWTKVLGTKSPFDGHNVYWKNRTHNKGNWNQRQQKLYKI
jgi:hypothetical protein